MVQLIPFLFLDDDGLTIDRTRKSLYSAPVNSVLQKKADHFTAAAA